MRFVYLCLIICIASCTKESAESPFGPAKVDSITQQFYTKYLIDFNKDGLNDLELEGIRYLSMNKDTSLFRAFSIGTSMEVHSEVMTQQYCTDTIVTSTFSYLNTRNCTSGNTNVTSSETFTATPYLTLSELSTKQVTPLTGFMTLMYTSVNNKGTPSPFAHLSFKGKGFFSRGNEGYMLVKFNGKRYGLKILSNSNPTQPLSLRSIVKVDP